LDTSEPQRNPLFAAIYGGHLAVAQLLVERGIDTSVKYNGDSMKGMDAYEFALEGGHFGIASYLKSLLP